MHREVEFTSYMTGPEKVRAIGYLPMHILILPLLAAIGVSMGRLTLAQSNMLVYGIGLIYMVCFMTQFLRREFDPLCDRLVYCLAHPGLFGIRRKRGYDIRGRVGRAELVPAAVLLLH